MSDENRKDWIDNADSYICPKCRMEVNNPAMFNMNRCPRCGWSPLDLQNVEYAPVVRCKDCDHYNERLCDCHNVNGPFGAIMEPDDFCSYGERKNNAEIVKEECGNG